MADSVVLPDGFLVNAPERADRLVKLLNAAGILNEHFDIFKSNIAAELEAYVEEQKAKYIDRHGHVAIETLLEAHDEGRRAGLEEAAVWLEQSICPLRHSEDKDSSEWKNTVLKHSARMIRELITRTEGATEANEGEKRELKYGGYCPHHAVDKSLICTCKEPK